MKLVLYHQRKFHSLFMEIYLRKSRDACFENKYNLETTLQKLLMSHFYTVSWKLPIFSLLKTIKVLQLKMSTQYCVFETYKLILKMVIWV